jgi:uncharacterized phage protein (TIGR01671 family)
MRTLKFRAQAVVNNKSNNIKVGDFVFGSYIESGCDAPCIIFGDGEQIEVDKKSLGQLVGQKDCDGNNTYEGDIVSKKMIDDSVHKCVIRYSDRYAKFIFCPLSETWDFDKDVVDNPFERNTYRVSGNMHQNPELLSI